MLCKKCSSNQVGLEGGTNEGFRFICDKCNYSRILTSEEVNKYAEKEFNDFKEIIDFDKYTIENLTKISSNEFSVHVYYEGEKGGYDIPHSKLDSSYNDKNIEYINIYGGFICIYISGTNGVMSEPIYRLREE